MVSQKHPTPRKWMPASCLKSQMLAAAIMWSLVGIFLFLRGLLHIINLTDPYKPLWISVALVAGLFKAKVVLEKTARKIVTRISKRPEPSCLFGFMPSKSWLLILGMILLGILLRKSPLNRSLVWSIYIAIGAALFASSRIFWMSWKRWKTMGESSAKN